MLLERTTSWSQGCKHATTPVSSSAAPWISSVTPSSAQLCRRPRRAPRGTWSFSNFTFVSVLFLGGFAEQMTHPFLCEFQACPEWEPGAGSGPVALGVQGGGSAACGGCLSPPCRGDHTPQCLHHHRPCGECLITTQKRAIGDYIEWNATTVLALSKFDIG